MKSTQIKTGKTLTLLLAGLLVTAGVMAEKPDFAAGGKNGKAKHNQVQEQQGD